jgi:hypothetical protein
MEDLKNLLLNHTYLIRYGCQKELFSITVLLVTNNAYYIRWNNGTHKSKTWESKECLESQYYLTEDISDFVEPEKPITSDLKAEFIKCLNCNGIGCVCIRDSNNDAGITICPVCFGNKYVTKLVKVSGK